MNPVPDDLSPLVDAQDAFAPAALQPPYPVTERPIFALVIGINSYQGKSAPTLRGCVNDSKSVCAYLNDILRVPETNIALLNNEQATRQKILDTFESHLIHNPAIARGDAIIFYFAGHGSRQRAPVDWHSEDSRVETICPYDVAQASGIPDYTFTHLLRRLAFHKGNNVTLIIDSCHSGGMGRAEIGPDDNAPLIRCYDPPNDFLALSADLDRGIWSWKPDGEQSDYAPKPELPGSLYNAMGTHILLAACQPRQLAREKENDGVWSGAFTTALISSLKAWDPSASSLTYSRLIEHLPPVAGQHPHCEGRNKVRRLFSPSDDQMDDPSWFVVSAAAPAGGPAGHNYYVAAGYLLGVVKGTEFITHPSEGYGSAPITLVAAIVEEFRCVAVPHRDSRLPSASILPHHSRATVLKWTTKWLRVELDPRDAFPHITEDDETLFSIVQSGGDLKVSRTDKASKSVQLVRNDPLIRSQPECHRMSIPSDTFARHYLDKAARFHFFLYQHNKSYNSTQLYRSLDNPDPNAMSITASLRRLTLAPSLTGLPSYMPVGENLFRAPAHADVTSGALAGAAMLEGSASDIHYALTLENHTSTDFFPYVFFFDPRKYHIESLYLPPSHISSPLTRRGTDGSTLGIGYGAQGTDSMSFTLPEGLDHDSAFFKIFVSTVYINMEAIVTKGERLCIKKVNLHSIEQCWDSWVYSVTVRR